MSGCWHGLVPLDRGNGWQWSGMDVVTAIVDAFASTRTHLMREVQSDWVQPCLPLCLFAVVRSGQSEPTFIRTRSTRCASLCRIGCSLPMCRLCLRSHLVQIGSDRLGSGRVGRRVSSPRWRRRSKGSGSGSRGGSEARSRALTRLFEKERDWWRGDGCNWVCGVLVGYRMVWSALYGCAGGDVHANCLWLQTLPTESSQRCCAVGGSHAIGYGGTRLG